MAFDEGLAERLRDLFRDKDIAVSEKKKFGGLAFMQNGYMFVGIVKDMLMALVGPENYSEALNQAHSTEMDFTGKQMKGYVYVTPEGFETDQELEKWAMLCADFIRTLPPK